MLEMLRDIWEVMFPPKIEFLNFIPNEKAHETDACPDLKARGIYRILPGERVKINTGVRANIPVNHFVELRPRSGLSSDGLTLLGSPATVDAGYTGVWFVPLRNDTDKPIVIREGTRVAQWRLERCKRWKGKIVFDLMKTPRGNKGFGSSGKL